MLFIDKNNIKIQKALDVHFMSVKTMIRKKLRKINTGIPTFLSNILLDDDFIKLLICGEPQELIYMDNMIWEEMGSFLNHVDRIQILNKKSETLTPEEEYYKYFIKFYNKKICEIIDYDNWFIQAKPNDQYSAYHLAENLNRRSCTYCNRSYTTTMTDGAGGKLMRPQFDHWFPKSKYPLLALSFYNLIPSCSICNSSVKGDMVLNLNDHVHPYINSNQTDEFSFDFLYKNLIDVEIYITKNGISDKAFNTFKKLQIETMYNSHHDELKDLIKIKQSYSDTYIQSIQNLFPNKELSYNEIYRLLFGTELNSIDFHKRPLSKFKSDILKNLGIID